MSVLGIIAGEGRLPFVVAQNARKQGISKLCAVCFEGQTDPDIVNYVDETEWVGLGQLGKLIGFLKINNAQEAVFIGRIVHNVVLKNIKLDFKMVQLAMKIKDWRTDSILCAIADEITKSGIDVTDSTKYLKDLFLTKGVVTKKTLTEKQDDDVKFGFFIAKKLAGLDVGQTVVVKKKTVLALEAIEGTDQTILRGGELGKKDVVVVKVSKPNQDMRFDVPVIGETTVEKLHKAGASVLAVEAGKTLVIDVDKLVKLADKFKISIVAVDPSDIEDSGFDKK